MTASDWLFCASVTLTLGGALVVVAARWAPIANAVGVVVSLAGVALAAGLAGAPLVGGLQLLVAVGVALVGVIFGLDLVGTGRDALPPPTARRMIGRACVAALAVATIAWVARLAHIEIAPGQQAASGAAGVQALGVGLFGDAPIVVGTLGLVLLVAVLASATLAVRGRS